MAHSKPASTESLTGFSFDQQCASASEHPSSAARCRLRGELRDWLTVAWVLWWSWAYVQGALAQRFPHLLGWTRTLW